MPSREEAAARFKRVATKRLERVIRDLRLLGKCGDKRNYCYTPEQVDKIRSLVEESLKDTMNKFVLKVEKKVSL